MSVPTEVTVHKLTFCTLIMIISHAQYLLIINLIDVAIITTFHIYACGVGKNVTFYIKILNVISRKWTLKFGGGSGKFPVNYSNRGMGPIIKIK